MADSLGFLLFAYREELEVFALSPTCFSQARSA